MKKEVRKPLAFAVVLIICFSVLLTVGAFFVINSEKDETSFQKEPSFNIDTILNSDLPTAQKEMIIKYSVYNHVDETGKVIKLFSDEQSKSFKKRKKKGERIYLTYDDVLFLINDTIRIYNTYDEVILTDLTDHTIPINKNLFKSGDQTIKTYHGDFSEFNNVRAKSEYSIMKESILEILNYRISVLTTEYLTARIVDTSTYNFFWYDLTFDDDYLPNKTVRYDRILLIEKDGETLSLKEKKEQIEKKANGFDTFIDSPYVEGDKNEERFYTFQLVSSGIQYHFESGSVTMPDNYIVESNLYLYNGSKVALGDERSSPERWAKLCYPTEELSAKYPSWELKPSYFETDKVNISLGKKYGYGYKTIGEITLNEKEAVESLIKLIDREFVINTKTDVDPLYIPWGEYLYSICLLNGTTIYLPANEAFDTYVSIESSNDEDKDAIKCEYKITKEFSEKIREMLNSELDEFLKNDIDYQNVPQKTLEKFENIPSEKYIKFNTLIAKYEKETKGYWTHSDNFKLLLDSTNKLIELMKTDSDYALLALRLSYSGFPDNMFFIRMLALENEKLQKWCEMNNTQNYSDIKQELSENFEEYFR